MFPRRPKQPSTIIGTVSRHMHHEIFDRRGERSVYIEIVVEVNSIVRRFEYEVCIQQLLHASASYVPRNITQATAWQGHPEPTVMVQQHHNMMIWLLQERTGYLEQLLCLVFPEIALYRLVNDRSTIKIVTDSNGAQILQHKTPQELIVSPTLKEQVNKESERNYMGRYNTIYFRNLRLQVREQALTVIESITNNNTTQHNINLPLYDTVEREFGIEPFQTAVRFIKVATEYLDDPRYKILSSLDKLSIVPVQHLIDQYQNHIAKEYHDEILATLWIKIYSFYAENGVDLSPIRRGAQTKKSLGYIVGRKFPNIYNIYFVLAEMSTFFYTESTITEAARRDFDE